MVKIGSKPTESIDVKKQKNEEITELQLKDLVSGYWLEEIVFKKAFQMNEFWNEEGFQIEDKRAFISMFYSMTLHIFDIFFQIGVVRKLLKISNCLEKQTEQLHLQMIWV